MPEDENRGSRAQCVTVAAARLRRALPPPAPVAQGTLHQANAITSIDIATATGFWGRFKGLMFTSAMPHGLLLLRCASVHSCWMRYPLDIVYVDAQGRVSKLVEGLKPWRASVGDRRAAHTLELFPGSIRQLQIRLGDRFAHAALQIGPDR